MKRPSNVSPNTKYNNGYPVSRARSRSEPGVVAGSRTKQKNGHSPPGKKREASLFA